MRELFMMSALAVFCLIPSAMAQSAPEGAVIDLQDVDADGDGHVSSAESQAYIKKLQDDEAARQRAAQPVSVPVPPPLPAVTAPAPVKPPLVYKSAPSTPIAAPEAEPDKEAPRTRADVPKNELKKFDARQAEMKKFDTNGDGILQASELSASSGDKFDAADKNKDGTLTPDEMEASLEAFKAEQGKAQGQGMANEQAARLKNKYRQADTDGDDVLSAEEYKTFMDARQGTFDQDGDGIISPDEYRGDGEKLPSSYKPKRD